MSSPTPLYSAAENAQIVQVVCATTGVAFATVLARLYVRCCVSCNFSWDDAAVALAASLSVGAMSLVLGFCRWGPNTPSDQLSADDQATTLNIAFISQPFYLTAIATAKVSIGASLLRNPTTRFLRIAIISTMAFVTLSTSICIFIIFVQCGDIRVFWDPNVVTTCWSRNVVYGLSYTYLVLNGITDLLLAIVLPLPLLWTLNINRRTRLALAGILCLGVLASSAAFVRLGYVTRQDDMNAYLWHRRNITIWMSTELNVGVIAASMPSLRPLFSCLLEGSCAAWPRARAALKHLGQGAGRIMSLGKGWRRLSSRHGNEASGTDTESQHQHHRNAQQLGSAYEMCDFVLVPGGATSRTTILSTYKPHENNDSADGVSQNDSTSHGRIQAVTETKVEVGSFDRRIWVSMAPGLWRLQ